MALALEAGLILVWLAPLAVYDLRRSTVPHIAWVAGPGALAMGYAIWHGDWSLAVMGIVGLLASERHHLPKGWRKWIFWWGLITTLGLITFTNPESLPGALAVIGFWLCFEAGWWAGADALVAMTLALVWPDTLLLAAMAGAHLGLSALRPTSLPLGRSKGFRILKRLTPNELALLGQPGLPALALTVGLYVILRLGDLAVR